MGMAKVEFYTFAVLFLLEKGGYRNETTVFGDGCGRSDSGYLVQL